MAYSPNNTVSLGSNIVSLGSNTLKSNPILFAISHLLDTNNYVQELFQMTYTDCNIQHLTYYFTHSIIYSIYRQMFKSLETKVDISFSISFFLECHHHVMLKEAWDYNISEGTEICIHHAEPDNICYLKCSHKT